MLLGYVALVSVAVALVIYFLFTLSDINSRYRDVISRDLNILEQANNIRSSVQRQMVVATRYEQLGDDSLRLEYSVAVQDGHAAIEAIKPYLTSPDDLRAIENISDTATLYSGIAQETMDLARQVATGAVAETTLLDLRRVQGETERIQLDRTLETFIARKNSQIGSTQAALNAKVEETSTYMLLWSMLGLIATAIAGALLVESIASPLRRLMRNIQGISHGDLETAVAVRSRDEVGELATVLEDMRRRLATAASENERLLASAREEADKLTEARARLQVANRELQSALETELEARKRMEEIDRLKAEFTSMVSHELKTPVSYIYNYAGALKEHNQNLNEGQRVEFLTAVQGEAQHLITLIDDIMAISLLEAGGLVHRFVETDLRKIVDSVVRDQSLTTRRHQISVKGPEALPVRGDPTRLRQVFNNLVSNAIKYSPQGGPVEVRLRANEVDNTAIVYVRDHGIGVNPADVPKLYDRFSRVLSQDTLTIPGSGLGLYIAHHIVQAHGGTLTIQPAPGEGTIAEITVPMIVESEVAAVTPGVDYSQNGHPTPLSLNWAQPKNQHSALSTPATVPDLLEEGVVVNPVEAPTEPAISEITVISTVDLSDTLPAYKPLTAYPPPELGQDSLSGSDSAQERTPTQHSKESTLSEAPIEIEKEKEPVA
jgi:signal transduction histidine kinase